MHSLGQKAKHRHFVSMLLPGVMPLTQPCQLPADLCKSAGSNLALGTGEAASSAGCPGPTQFYLYSCGVQAYITVLIGHFVLIHMYIHLYILMYIHMCMFC